MLTLAIGVSGTALTWRLLRVARRTASVERARRLAPTARTLPPRVRRRVAALLDAAAIDLAPEEAARWWATTIAISGLVGLGVAPVIAALGAAGAGVGGPVVLWSARGRRARLLAAALPDALDDLAGELRAGGTIVGGIGRLAGGSGVLADEMRRVEARTGLGARVPDALAAWARETSATGARSFAGALALSATVGGRCAGALEGLASSLRERHAVVAEARALSAQARSSAAVMVVGPAGYLVWSAVADRRSLDALVATTPGRVCLVVGVALEVVGVLWMRRIARPVAP